MKTKLLTDIELRSHWMRTRQPVYTVEEGTMLTPAARDFIHDHNIQLCFVSPQKQSEKMTTTPIPSHDGKAQYIVAATGAELTEKPEEMTHLRGNLLVPKTHPQIAFRGKLDSLMARIMEVQRAAVEERCENIADDLEELLGYVRQILAAEVKDEPLARMHLLGMDSARIRRVSQHVKEEIGIDHPIPSYQMGRVCVELNSLRALVREVELSAATAFTDADGVCVRKDIVEGLNRLSSCVYILFCRKVAGFYDRENKQ